MTQTNQNKDYSWQWVPGYEGLYGVTRDGRVWGAGRHRSQEGWRKLATNWRDYKVIGLRKDGQTKHYGVHRLVAMTYIPNPDNLPQVNHMNGIRDDNHVENLEWCDALYNQQHARRIGLHKRQARGERHGSAKLSERDVLTIFKSKTPPVQLAREYGMTLGAVRDIQLGRSWSWLTNTGGYKRPYTTRIKAGLHTGAEI